MSMMIKAVWFASQESIRVEPPFPRAVSCSVVLSPRRRGGTEAEAQLLVPAPASE